MLVHLKAVDSSQIYLGGNNMRYYLQILIPSHHNWWPYEEYILIENNKPRRLSDDIIVVTEPFGKDGITLSYKYNDLDENGEEIEKEGTLMLYANTKVEVPYTLVSSQNGYRGEFQFIVRCIDVKVDKDTMLDRAGILLMLNNGYATKEEIREHYEKTDNVEGLRQLDNMDKE